MPKFIFFKKKFKEFRAVRWFSDGDTSLTIQVLISYKSAMAHIRTHCTDATVVDNLKLLLR